MSNLHDTFEGWLGPLRVVATTSPTSRTVVGLYVQVLIIFFLFLYLFILNIIAVFLQRLLDWMEEYNREGIFCLWLGPTYPSVLIYKPDLAEVRYSLVNKPFVCLIILTNLFCLLILVQNGF